MNLIPASTKNNSIYSKISRLKTNRVDNNNFVYIVHSYKSIQSKNFPLLQPLILKLHHRYYPHQAIHYNVKPIRNLQLKSLSKKTNYF